MTRAKLSLRKNLLDRLAAVQHSWQQAFALLYTYFPSAGHVSEAQGVVLRTPLTIALQGGVTDVQDVRGDAFIPARLTPARYRNGARIPINLTGLLGDLTSLIKFDEFEVQALRWLKRVDLELGASLPRLTATSATVRGLDNHDYWVGRTNNGMAYYLNDALPQGDDEGAELPVTYAGTQSPTLRAYCRCCTLIPKREHPHFHVQPDSLAALARGKSADLRLAAEWEARRLKVLIWPFRVPVRFDEKPSQTSFALRKVVNEADVVQDAVEALATARREQATFLLFPELAIPAAAEAALRSELAKHGRRDYPILTVGGRVMCDVTEAAETVCVNEAFLLGPRGEPLGAHRKLTSYQIPKPPLREATTRHGTQIRVLESALGNLCVLICLDLLLQEIKTVLKETSYANLLMVPSLSPTTSAHLISADELFQAMLANTFVCNHRLFHPDFPPEPNPPHGATVDQGASFWRVAHGKRNRRTLMHPPGKPYFWFDLQQFVEESSQST